MPKSQIIKDIVEDNVSLEKSLTRLLVLAKDVKNKQLEVWVQKELNGYSKEDELPQYRRADCPLLEYSGINGNFQVTNVPLPQHWLEKETFDMISTVSIYDGVRSVNERANNTSASYRDLTAFAGEIYKKSGGSVSCTSIKHIIPQAVYQTVCSEVKTKMITALYELEKRYGCLDELGIDISNRGIMQIKADNADLNRSVFNITVANSETKKERWYSKVAWNVVVPIITGIIGAVVATIIIKIFEI